MADRLRVEVVAADRLVWSGEATVVNARTAGGEIGILADHMPVLSLLDPGAVEVKTDSETITVAVDEGFLSVANNRVSVLSGHAEMAGDIDLQQARRDLEDAKNSGEDGEAAQAAVRRLEARVRVAEQAS